MIDFQRITSTFNDCAFIIRLRHQSVFGVSRFEYRISYLTIRDVTN